MSHFYGKVRGQSKMAATRRGNRTGGLETYAAGWSGAIHVAVYERDGRDHFIVEMVPWLGGGRSLKIAEGVLGQSLDFVATKED